MINLIETGKYKLSGSKDKMVLSLGDKDYLWTHARGIGELLTLAKKSHPLEYTLAQGDFTTYAVKDEPGVVDLEHLELSLGHGEWQGYLLLTGLPTPDRIRRRIIPTDEVISNRNSS